MGPPRPKSLKFGRACHKGAISTIGQVQGLVGFSLWIAVSAHAQEAPLLERHGHRAHVVDNTVYAFGGYGRGARDHDAKQILSWSPGDSTWKPRAGMTVGRSFFGSALLDGTIYAVGSSIERYDTRTDEWTTVFDDPGLPRSHHTVAMFRDRLHVVGGIPDEVSGHHVFEPSSGALSAAPPPPGFARGDHLHILAVLDDHLHCVGGIGETPGHAAFDGEAWTERAAPPEPLNAKFAVSAVIGRSLFVIGQTASVRYDVDSDRWREIATLPHMLAMPVAVVRNGMIEVLGGRRVDGKGYGAGRYDPSTDRWHLRGEPDTPGDKSPSP